MDLTGWYVVAIYPRRNGKRLIMEHAKNGRVDITADQIDNVYICGYKAKDLLVLKVMLEDENIQPSDLNEYVRNVEHIYTKLQQDFFERIQAIVNKLAIDGFEEGVNSEREELKKWRL